MQTANYLQQKQIMKWNLMVFSGIQFLETIKFFVLK